VIPHGLIVDRVTAPWLPENWLPSALSLIDAGPAGPRRVFLFDPASGTIPGPIDLDDAVVADPARLSAALAPSLGAGQLGWIGPAGSVGTGAAQLHPAGGGDGATEALVLIDQGIAAWHPTLRAAFAGLLFLPPDGRPAPTDLLDKAALATLSAQADAGDMSGLIRVLAARAPHSLYARSPALPHALSGAIWHGTSVASAALPRAGRVAYGIELPDAATRDWTGGMLQALLPAAIAAALAMTAHLAHLPLTILLPYAFTGSPLDGTHPVARAVSGLLAVAERPVTLVVPAGNHRQDACAATAPDGRLTWHIPPDDASGNAMDLSAEVDPAALHLILPDGTAADLMVARGEVAILRYQGRCLAVAARPVTESFRLRLAVMPAASGAPFGRWQIVAPGTALQATVLRDDRDGVMDGPHPRRQSWLVADGQSETGPDGAPLMDDASGATVTRRGTLSVLATIPGARIARATARAGAGQEVTAAYSGLHPDGVERGDPALVDDGWPDCGWLALAGTGPRRLRLSGTSLAAGLCA
jgi:hypothetical protein